MSTLALTFAPIFLALDASGEHEVRVALAAEVARAARGAQHGVTPEGDLPRVLIQNWCAQHRRHGWEEVGWREVTLRPREDSKVWTDEWQPSRSRRFLRAFVRAVPTSALPPGVGNLRVPD